MTNLNQTVKRVFLQDYLNLEDVHRIVDYGPVVGIAAMDNRTEMVNATISLIKTQKVLLWTYLLSIVQLVGTKSGQNSINECCSLLQGKYSPGIPLQKRKICFGLFACCNSRKFHCWSERRKTNPQWWKVIKSTTIPRCSWISQYEGYEDSIFRQRPWYIHIVNIPYCHNVW